MSFNPVVPLYRIHERVLNSESETTESINYCYDWVVEPPVHVHEVRLQVATLSGCSR